MANIQTTKNPISAARMLMDSSKYIFISGAGADVFAENMHLEIMQPAHFYTKHQVKRWIEAQDSTHVNQHLVDSIGSIITDAAAPAVNKKFGTVNCVVLDKYGNLADGTSSGGLMNKMYGRIGDSPIIGAGTYAYNATCAISCTGTGEDFLKTGAAKTVSDLMEFKGLTVQQATDEMILHRFLPIHGDGGMIAVDRYGHVAFSFNSEGMFRGFSDDITAPNASIYQ